MTTHIWKKMLSSLLCGILSVSCMTATVFAIDGKSVSGAFGEHWDEVQESYETSFGWDYNKHLEKDWTDDDTGNEYERQAGYQEEWYRNNILTTNNTLVFRLEKAEMAAISLKSRSVNLAWMIPLKSRRTRILSNTMTGTMAATVPDSGARRSSLGAQMNVTFWKIQFQRMPVVQVCLRNSRADTATHTILFEAQHRSVVLIHLFRATLCFFQRLVI